MAKVPDIVIRGIRQVIPTGYILGRTKSGNGQPHLIPITDIHGTPGAPGAPGSNGVGVPTGGSTGQVLTKNSATDYDTGWATPSGGGGSGGGGGMSPFSPYVPLVRTASEFTLVKDAGTTASMTDTTRGVTLSVTGGGATDKNALMSQTPANPAAWSMTALISTPSLFRTYMSYGLFARDSGTGKIVAFTIAGYTSGAERYRRLQWNSLTSFSSSSDLGVSYTQPSPVWLKLEQASGNFIFSISSDGENFTIIETVSATGFLAATTDVGIFFGVNQSAAPTSVVEHLHVLGFGLDTSALSTTPYGSGTALATRPTIVQNKSFVNNTGAVTLDAAPTPGNLLVALGTHWTNNPTAATGWSGFDIINGATHDGLMGAMKVVNASDTATFTPFSGITAGASVTVFEIAGAFPAISLARNSFKEQTTTAYSQYAASGIDSCLVVGFASTCFASTAPTSISSVTTGTTVSGTTTSASPRQITPFHANADAATSLTITSTYAASAEQYGMCVVIPPAA